MLNNQTKSLRNLLTDLGLYVKNTANLLNMLGNLVVVVHKVHVEDMLCLKIILLTQCELLAYVYVDFFGRLVEQQRAHSLAQLKMLLQNCRCGL